MLSQAQNERLTRVSKGTPAGELLRRYWQPIAATVELEKEWVLPVRVMGEDLALFRTERGEYGLVAERCPHRGASLTYGIPDAEGLHCPYHGWHFNKEGQCIATPYDDTQGKSPLKEMASIDAYPVRELGGLLWTYMGPAPIPELPKWDILVEPGYVREITVTHLPCSYFQCMENSLDPVHFEWLHAQLTFYLAKRRGETSAFAPKRHLKIEFDEYEFGIVKRRLLEGDTEDSDDWTTGHPIIFPNTLAVGRSFQFRVPADDENTLHITYTARLAEPGEEPQTVVPKTEAPYIHDNGRLVVETILGQDMMAWVTQGPIAKREIEILAKSDFGIVMYRNMMLENLDKLERGEPLKGLVWDAERNKVSMPVIRENNALRAMRPDDAAPRVSNVNAPLLSVGV